MQGLRTQPGTGFKVLLSLACVVVVVAGLRLAGEFLVPVLLGVFLAVLSLPITKWLQARRLPRPLAVTFTVLFDILVLSVIVLIGTGIISDFQAEVPDYVRKLDKGIREGLTSLEDSLMAQERFDDIELVKSYDNLFDPFAIIGFVRQTDVIQKIASVLSKSFFVLIVMIFILAESERFAAKVGAVLQARGPDLQRFRRASQDIQKYLAIKTAVSAATGLLAWLVCLTFDLPFAILWGLVAFLFNYIPAIGSILAAIPPVLIAMVQPEPEIGGFWPAMGVLGCYLAINMVLGNFLEPTLLGDRFGISTVVVILSVLFWGYVWGPVGMFLAVPLTMVVKVMLDNSNDLRWISIAMGKNAPESEESPPGGSGNAEAGAGRDATAGAGKRAEGASV